MRRSLTVFWLSVSAVSGFAQGVPDYYRPPGERAGTYLSEPEHRLTEEPAAGRPFRKQRPCRVSLEQLVARYGEAYIRERWYLAAEGGFRSDRGSLSRTFGNLLGTRATTRTGWSALVGWAGSERWAVEAGYAWMPLHNTLLIGGSSNPLTLRFENNKHTLILRGKRLMRFGSRAARRAGFWLSAGIGLVPNDGRQVSRFRVEGYQYSYGGFRPTGPPRVDTVRMTGLTTVSPRLSGLAELSAEYSFKMGGRAEMSLFTRKYWGLGNSLTTDLSYRINSGEPRSALLSADGSGWSIGVSIRYSYSLRYDLKKMPGIFKVRGNSPKPIPL
ncbi:hypothetical protein [Larkinella soli]|uniref:hypothetical protein n=1 Tax=Larkinella soli TaxID=1770527 RepID=UPI000FFC164A|nr:hypothetical protein [Larkinella soli]